MVTKLSGFSVLRSYQSSFNEGQFNIHKECVMFLTHCVFCRVCSPRVNYLSKLRTKHNNCRRLSLYRSLLSPPSKFISFLNKPFNVSLTLTKRFSSFPFRRFIGRNVNLSYLSLPPAQSLVKNFFTFGFRCLLTPSSMPLIIVMN